MCFWFAVFWQLETVEKCVDLNRLPGFGGKQRFFTFNQQLYIPMPP